MPQTNMPIPVFNIGDQVIYIGCNHACPGYTPGFSPNIDRIPFGSRGEVTSRLGNVLVVRLADREGRAFASHFLSEREHNAISSR